MNSLLFENSRRALLAAGAGLALALASPQAVRADDNIFPAGPAAKPFIDFDGRGFLIKGQRTFLASGSLHYARVPRAMWRDRLLRFQRAGFNTVQTYVFWNAHETAAGQFSFQDENDLDGFLKEVKALGMFATVRLGPYGQPGSPAEVSFKLAGATVQGQLAPQLTAGADGSLEFSSVFSEGPQLRSFTAGAQRVRVLALSSAYADQTYFPSTGFAETGFGTWIVCGAPYVSEASFERGRLSLTLEQPWQDAPAAIVVWGESDTASVSPRVFRSSIPRPAVLPLSTWQVRDASAPAQPGFNDASWKKSEQPLQMGADGDASAYAWYRTRFSAPKAGSYRLSVASLKDRAQLWLDGARVDAAGVRNNGAVLELRAGAHTLAIFAAHDGRPKLFNYLGPLDTADPKGIVGPATLSQGSQGSEITAWRLKRVANNADKTAPPPADAPGWEAASIGPDVFDKKPGAAWFQAALPELGSAQRSLHFESVDEDATVFVNGQQVGSHRGWGQAFDVPVGAAWKAGGPNTLSVLIENSDGAGGIDKAVSLVPLQFGSPVLGWAMRGGPGDALDTTGYRPLAQAAASTSDARIAPRFLRATFDAPAYNAGGSHPIWRALMTGMSRGFVWLNGHSLGRYPERVPVEGLYLPEAWLKEQANSLVVFDEEGRAPSAVSLAAERAASRDEQRWSAMLKQ